MLQELHTAARNIWVTREVLRIDALVGGRHVAAAHPKTNGACIK
jgi:hypothetical protein